MAGRTESFDDPLQYQDQVHGRTYSQDQQQYSGGSYPEEETSELHQEPSLAQEFSTVSLHGDSGASAPVVQHNAVYPPVDDDSPVEHLMPSAPAAWKQLETPQASSTGYQVAVSEPEVRKGQLGRSYTAYSVTGTGPRGQTFATYHRFSDFLWLHQQLTKSFPGMFIPPLPPKKAVGRFEEEFINMRMLCLQRFMNRIAASAELSCSESFVQFLTSTESVFEQIKKSSEKEAKPSAADVLAKYKQMFAAIIQEDLSYASADKFEGMKDYIKQMTASLSLAREYCNEIVDSNKKLTDQTGKWVQGMNEICETELRLRQRLDLLSAVPRYDGYLALANYNKVLQDAPERNFQTVAGMLSMELMDVDAIRAAIQSRDECMAAANKAEDRVNEIKASIDKMRRSGKSVSVSLFSRKETTMEEKEETMRQAQVEESAAKELVQVVNKLLIVREFEYFRHLVVEEYRQTMRLFASLQRQEAEKVASLWAGMERDTSN
eukprot:GILK01000928.1.p1 GENE.GILK01000928.1~~GILK01000928.1.p1  ORF type:complete len:491 (-),score=113.92 GILK01000928.1:212-1684(-)